MLRFYNEMFLQRKNLSKRHLYKTTMSNPNDTTYYFDQEEVKNHIKIMKWTGVIGIILVSLSTPLYILASMEWSNNYPFDYDMEVNQTACSYLKQFDLKDNVILSVCNRDGEIMLDIRLFLNQTATIRGIPLNLRQWNVLQGVYNSVNRAIEIGKHM